VTVSSRFLLTFTLSDWVFGMPLDRVQEVQRMVELVPLPQIPEGPKGVMNLRGETVPVWELRGLLGYQSASIDPDQNIIIMKWQRSMSKTETPSDEGTHPGGAPNPGESSLRVDRAGQTAGRRQGFIVDHVHEVVDISQGQPAPLEGVPVATYLSGVVRLGGGLILVLDVDRILARTNDRARFGAGPC